MSGPVDIVRILNLLPHRYPFILVDRVLDYKEFDFFVQRTYNRFFNSWIFGKSF